MVLMVKETKKENKLIKWLKKYLWYKKEPKDFNQKEDAKTGGLKGSFKF